MFKLGLYLYLVTLLKKTKLVYIDVGSTLKNNTKQDFPKTFKTFLVSIAPLLLVKHNGDVNNVSCVQIRIVAQVETNYKLEDESWGGGGH